MPNPSDSFTPSGKKVIEKSYDEGMGQSFTDKQTDTSDPTGRLTPAKGVGFTQGGSKKIAKNLSIGTPKGSE